jgi:hypothetical protein
VSTVYVREIPEFVLDGLRLGRHVEHDSRSRDYTFTLPAKLKAQPLQSVRHQRFIPVLDQGSLGSCGGEAGEGAAGTGPVWQALPPALAAKPNQADEASDQTQAVQLYSAATRLDTIPGQYPPDDTGTTDLGVAKAMVQAGLISGYQHTFTLQDALTALQLVPVIVGMNWFTSMDMPDVNGLVTIAPGATVRGGHLVVADELDVTRQLVGFTNSWSAQWGLNGRFYLSWDDLGTLLGQQGDVTVPVPLSQPAPQPAQPAEPSAPSAPPTIEQLEQEMFAAFQRWAHARGWNI